MNDTGKNNVLKIWSTVEFCYFCTLIKKRDQLFGLICLYGHRDQLVEHPDLSGGFWVRRVLKIEN